MRVTTTTMRLTHPQNLNLKNCRWCNFFESSRSFSPSPPLSSSLACRYLSSSSSSSSHHPDDKFVTPPPLVITDRRTFVPTSRMSSTTEQQHPTPPPPPPHRMMMIPLALNDVYVVEEQLPYAYFFKERLGDIQLEQSLQCILQDNFSVLGGRICFDTNCIVLQDTDTVPLSIGRTLVPASDWLQLRHTTTIDQQTGKRRPLLLPIFDPLVPTSSSSSSSSSTTMSTMPLATIRITHIEQQEKDGSGDGGDGEGGTIIGVNISHAAADGASCIHFMYCWGRQHRQLTYPQPSHERAFVTSNGMLTADHVDLLNLKMEQSSTSTFSSPILDEAGTLLAGWASQVWGFSSTLVESPFMTTLLSTTTTTSTPTPMVKPKNSKKEGSEVEDSIPQQDQPEISPIQQSQSEHVEHEFVVLHFNPRLLTAMKQYGTKYCAMLHDEKDTDPPTKQESNHTSTSTSSSSSSPSSFVSTNDLVTAAGWGLMRQLSGREDWGMNIIVNIRGRTDDTHSLTVDGGLFGNGITAATAHIAPRKNSTPSRSSSSSSSSNTNKDDNTSTDNDTNNNDIMNIWTDEQERQYIVESALQCRRALTRCLDRLPEQLAASRRGKPFPKDHYDEEDQQEASNTTTSFSSANTGSGNTVPTTKNAFATTSWHFPLWNIDFQDDYVKGQYVEDDVEYGRPFAFHGQPVHPLPPGETFSAVIVPTAMKGLDYQLFLPLHLADEAKEYMKRLETLFL